MVKLSTEDKDASFWHHNNVFIYIATIGWFANIALVIVLLRRIRKYRQGSLDIEQPALNQPAALLQYHQQQPDQDGFYEVDIVSEARAAPEAALEGILPPPSHASHTSPSSHAPHKSSLTNENYQEQSTTSATIGKTKPKRFTFSKTFTKKDLAEKANDNILKLSMITCI